MIGLMNIKLNDLYKDSALDIGYLANSSLILNSKHIMLP